MKCNYKKESENKEEMTNAVEKDMKEMMKFLKEYEVIVDEKYMNVGGKKVMLIGEMIPKS